MSTRVGRPGQFVRRISFASEDIVLGGLDISTSNLPHLALAFMIRYMPLMYNSYGGNASITLAIVLCYRYLEPFVLSHPVGEFCV